MCCQDAGAQRWKETVCVWAEKYVERMRNYLRRHKDKEKAGHKLLCCWFGEVLFAWPLSGRGQIPDPCTVGVSYLSQSWTETVAAINVLIQIFKFLHYSMSYKVIMHLLFPLNILSKISILFSLMQNWSILTSEKTVQMHNLRDTGKSREEHFSE